MNFPESFDSANRSKSFCVVLTRSTPMPSSERRRRISSTARPFVSRLLPRGSALAELFPATPTLIGYGPPQPSPCPCRGTAKRSHLVSASNSRSTVARNFGNVLRMESDQVAPSKPATTSRCQDNPTLPGLGHGCAKNRMRASGLCFLHMRGTMQSDSPAPAESRFRSHPSLQDNSVRKPTVLLPDNVPSPPAKRGRVEAMWQSGQSPRLQIPGSSPFPFRAQPSGAAYHSDAPSVLANDLFASTVSRSVPFPLPCAIHVPIAGQ